MLYNNCVVNAENKSDYKIKLINSQGVELKGYYFPSNSNKWVMYVHGFAGGFDPFLYDIVNDCQSNNINFLFAGNQGLETITKLKKHVGDKVKEINGGGSYENVENIIPDLNCFIKFALDNGCKELILIGYSFGCDKVVKYISNNTIKCVAQLIFISPQDMAKNCDYNMLQQAQLNIDNNEPNKVLDDLFLGFCPISSKSLWTLANDKSINNFPYLSLNPDFNIISQINIPTHFIIGTNDQGLENSTKSAKQCMQLLTSTMKNANFLLINGAKHTYKHYYNELSGVVEQIIAKK